MISLGRGDWWPLIPGRPVITATLVSMKRIGRLLTGSRVSAGRVGQPAALGNHGRSDGPFQGRGKEPPVMHDGE